MPHNGVITNLPFFKEFNYRLFLKYCVKYGETVTQHWCPGKVYVCEQPTCYAMTVMSVWLSVWLQWYSYSHMKRTGKSCQGFSIYLFCNRFPCFRPTECHKMIVCMHSEFILAYPSSCSLWNDATNKDNFCTEPCN